MQKTHGFTLVELSIVLVIIGLLIGGILGGQELIRASELNSVATDVTRYKTAINAFKLKYNGLPGDINNASSYWPTTANGDANGRISWLPESLRAWTQLSLSGIIPGNYTGIIGTGAAPGVNIPAAKITGAGFGIYNMDMNGSSVAAEELRFLLGAFVTTSTTSNLAAIINAIDASSIDTKIDDGLPRSGIVSGYTGASGTGSCFSGSAYLLTNTAISCIMTFKF